MIIKIFVILYGGLLAVGWLLQSEMLLFIHAMATLILIGLLLLVVASFFVMAGLKLCGVKWW